MPLRSTSVRALAAATIVAVVALAAAATPADAQMRTVRTGTFEITPFGGYSWGGTFDTHALDAIPDGKLHEQDTFSWGVILSKMEGSTSAAELWYLRQDSDVIFAPKGESERTVGKISNNYIQAGGRHALQAGKGLSPFVSASLGANILDSDAGDATWRFAFTLGGGARFPLPNKPNVALRFDARWMVTLVPSGSYESWCGVWGCYAAEDSAWLNQGQVSAGLSIGF